MGGAEFIFDVEREADHLDAGAPPCSTTDFLEQAGAQADAADGVAPKILAKEVKPISTDSFLILRFRQAAWRIVRFAVQLLDLFHKARPVIAFGVRERP